MHSLYYTLLASAGLWSLGAAQTVSGAAQGFAEGVTGGGNISPVTPSSLDELKSLLGDTEPRIILIDREWDFTDSEGTESGTVCASWGNGAACQKIIQDECGSDPASTATWPKAPRSPIDVGSDKTILGVGSSGTIKGKGLRFRGGTTNVIVQNIAITDLNPEYVWGGDALSFDGSDLIWIDHVTTARTGRQHYVFGFEANKRITLSNNFINGETPFSTGCDNHHYWTFEMVGADDQITLQNNYIYMTAGRSPALSFGTLLHAVNNVWEDNTGHALEGGEPDARGLYEGNAFVDVRTLVADYAGRLFAATDGGDNAQCEAALGRACEPNAFDGTDNTMAGFTDTSFFGDFNGLSIAPAISANEAASQVPNNAGAGKNLATATLKVKKCVKKRTSV